MVRLSALAFTAILSIGQAFIPSPPSFQQRGITSITNTQPSSTQMSAAPTMFIYWSIKTAIDTIAYGLGASDEVKGTGVWSAFELKRAPKDEDDDDDKKDDE